MRHPVAGRRVDLRPPVTTARSHRPAHTPPTCRVTSLRDLGLWQEDIDSQLASIAASEAAGAHGQSGWMDQFHSDDFIAYAYLQSGQEDRARAIVGNSQKAIDHYEAMPDMVEHTMMVGMFPYYRVKLPLFLALETRDWRAGQAFEPVAGAPPDTQLQIPWARIISDGHLHDAGRAHADLAAYDALMEAVRKGDHAYAAESTGAQIRRGEMLAWLAFASGDTDAAVKQMRDSADLQDKVGQGEVDIPAREMLGDILLESNRPRDALVEIPSIPEAQSQPVQRPVRCRQSRRGRRPAGEKHAAFMRRCSSRRTTAPIPRARNSNTRAPTHPPAPRTSGGEPKRRSRASADHVLPSPSHCVASRRVAMRRCSRSTYTARHHIRPSEGDVLRKIVSALNNVSLAVRPDSH